MWVVIINIINQVVSLYINYGTRVPKTQTISKPRLNEKTWFKFHFVFHADPLGDDVENVVNNMRTATAGLRTARA